MPSLPCRLVLIIVVAINSFAQAPAAPATEEQAAVLRELISKSPRAKVQASPLQVQLPTPDWTTDYVSWVAVGRSGLVYLLHRNLKVDPVVALDKNGKIVRSWGR